MPSKLDEYLNNASPEDKAAIEEAKLNFDKSGIEAEEVSNTEVGKDNVNVADDYKKSEPTNEITEEVGAEAQEAAEGAKEAINNEQQDLLSKYPPREPQEQEAEQEQEIEQDER